MDKKCPSCDGYGKFEGSTPSCMGGATIPCKTCHGTGEVKIYPESVQIGEFTDICPSCGGTTIMTDEEIELEQVAEDMLESMNEELDSILDPVEDYSDHTEPI